MLHNVRSIWRTHKAALLVLSVFAVVYALISFVNHANYRTYALDLGLYTHAAWKYAHFQLADRSLAWVATDPLLADHFDLHLILWSPLIWVLGEWTLLVVQWCAVLIGGWGIYRYALEHSADRTVATFAMGLGLSYFGIFTAFAFDYHTNVVAAMALPWYLLALRKGRTARSWWLLFFMISGKENIGLWMAVVVVATLWLFESGAVARRTLVAQALVAFCWSALAIGVVMPALSDEGQYAHGWKYPILGRHPADIITSLFTHPLTIFRALFEDIEQRHPFGTALKLEFYLLMILSGGWALFRRWAFLLMAMPLIAQKMLHWEMGNWGLFGQYSVEFAMVLPLAVVHALDDLRQVRWRRAVIVATCAGSVGSAIYTMDFPLEHASIDGYQEHIRFYQGMHYGSRYYAHAIDRALEVVPDGVPTSALSPLVPHLIERDELHQFPIIGNAMYIVLPITENSYPMSLEEYRQRTNDLRNDPKWEILVDDGEVLVLKRR